MIEILEIESQSIAEELEIKSGSKLISINGKEVHAGHAVPRVLRRNMQAVFQDPYGSFNPRHKVARLVSEPFH